MQGHSLWTCSPKSLVLANRNVVPAPVKNLIRVITRPPARKKAVPVDCDLAGVVKNVLDLNAGIVGGLNATYMIKLGPTLTFRHSQAISIIKKPNLGEKPVENLICTDESLEN